MGVGDARESHVQVLDGGDGDVLRFRHDGTPARGGTPAHDGTLALEDGNQARDDGQVDHCVANVLHQMDYLISRGTDDCSLCFPTDL